MRQPLYRLRQQPLDTVSPISTITSIICAHRGFVHCSHALRTPGYSRYGSETMLTSVARDDANGVEVRLETGDSLL
ncbi:unnamed protein product, partial [Mesorhabditis spiculigera]